MCLKKWSRPVADCGEQHSQFQSVESPTLISSRNNSLYLTSKWQTGALRSELLP